MAYRRIHNKGDWRQEELVAAGTISPGMLLEVTTSGTIQAHSSEGGDCERLVALEDAKQGKTVTDNYSAANVVDHAVVAPGAVMNMLVAIGEAGNPGQAVISAGDGTLKLEGSVSSGVTVEQIVGYIDASEAAFTTLAANTLKAIRLR